MDENTKIENLKFILKWTGIFGGPLALFCGLTTLPFTKNLTNFEDNNVTIMEAAVYSAIGFTFTAFLDGLAILYIKRKYRYFIQGIFYIFCGISYIISSLLFSITIYHFIFARFGTHSSTLISYGICVLLCIVTASQIISFSQGW
jgi:hypothetical protein